MMSGNDAPPITVMKSRRLMAISRPTRSTNGNAVLGTGPSGPRSVPGQTATSGQVRMMSVHPSTTDILLQGRHVCFVPEGDSCSAANRALFDHLVGAS